MRIIVVGLSHKTAPVETRDKVALSGQTLTDVLHELKGSPLLHECVILSTCNRTEVYATTKDPDTAHTVLIDFFCRFDPQEAETIRQSLFFLRDRSAIQHIFEVACGLDSMVVGEPQVTGQVKEAHAIALASGTTGVLLNRLFQTATEVSKRARTETEIGAGAVSISFAAVELAKTIFGKLEGRTACLIGAGEMSELTAKHLFSAGVTSFFVVSRTLERATRLAAEIGGHAYSFSEGIDSLHRADIVISSTSAPYYIITRDIVATAMRRRKNAPVFFIDIAVPRDINPAVGEIYNVFLYNIDDLQSVVANNLAKREQEAERVRQIIAEELSPFLAWWNTLDVVPVIVSLREKFQQIGEIELSRLLPKLHGISEADAATLLRSFMNKLLHEPITKLKAAAEADDGLTYVEALRYLFSLQEPECEPPSSSVHEAAPSPSTRQIG
ncbi:MAG: glutamyl-tRNA reductase [Candidatus Latescibacteria bacterium]|nr:glutamyl-tRNA reductase [Candidatus Latescibacterota bacterium]